MPTKKTAGSAVDIQPQLLDIIVCPVSGMPLIYDAENQRLISQAAQLAYPIKQGVPVLVAAEAKRLRS